MSSRTYTLWFCRLFSFKSRAKCWSRFPKLALENNGVFVSLKSKLCSLVRLLRKFPGREIFHCEEDWVSSRLRTTIVSRICKQGCFEFIVWRKIRTFCCAPVLLGHHPPSTLWVSTERCRRSTRNVEFRVDEFDINYPCSTLFDVIYPCFDVVDIIYACFDVTFWRKHGSKFRQKQGGTKN